MQTKNSDSYIWKGLQWAKDILMEGSYWELGSGQNINIWIDHWIPCFPHQKLSLLIENIHNVSLISSPICSLLQESQYTMEIKSNKFGFLGSCGSCHPSRLHKIYSLKRFDTLGKAFFVKDSYLTLIKPMGNYDHASF